MKRLLMTVLVLVGSAAMAKEVVGVKMPDTLSVEGKDLKLNGMGVRVKIVFKVYVAGLYLESTSNDPAKILAADQTRRVDMHMLRDLEKAKIVEAIKTGFEKNSKDAMPKLQERLEKFVAVIPDLKEGQVLSLSYVPGKGTTVNGPNKETFTAEGKDFADALFSVWLGQNPVDSGLKDGMLGK